MGATTTEVPAPDLQCDVVMKGGITSGVIYPTALVRLSDTYRLRGLGGTSACAIGAAVGAAAEFGRDRGGFVRLAELPASLGGGALGELFHPARSTSGLLRLLFAYLQPGRSGRPRRKVASWFAVGFAAARAFPLASVLGVVPGVAVLLVGIDAGHVAGALLAVLGVLLAVVGWLVAIGGRLYRVLTVSVPENLFGICRGLGTPGKPGFTEWLDDAIDRTAGLSDQQRPLLFGDLWTGQAIRPAAGTCDQGAWEIHTGGGDLVPVDPVVDLRMITTCLSYGRPFELPMKARNFFYDEAVWASLFPPHVMAALRDGTAPVAPSVSRATSESEWFAIMASRRGLRRLPEARVLPVIVATRLSLSFPGLISAVPLWDVDFADPGTLASLTAFREAKKVEGAMVPDGTVEFRQVWFSDGGLCSNFPVHFFDGALTTRPTFAINLGSFPDDGAPGSGQRQPDPDQRKNIEYAHSNSDLLSPRWTKLRGRGIGAMSDFAGSAFSTARNWHDSSHLDFPGYRDRIVKVFQTDREGGLNLNMDEPTITGLGERGRVAADAIAGQFHDPHYAGPTASGWDNHRWIRYRALLAALPAWLRSYAAGRDLLDIDPAAPPSYAFDTVGGRRLAADLAAALDQAVEVVERADARAVQDLTGVPNPEGVIRRVPRT
jgi:hypothetical protein